MTWAAIGGAAISVVGGAIASRQANKKSASQKAIENQTASNIQMQGEYGQKLLTAGTMGMDQFDAFWKKIATGDRAAALQLLAPQMALADEQNRAAANSGLLLGGRRSGISAEASLASRDASLANRNNLLLGLKADSVNMLGDSATNRATMGANLLTGSSSGATSYLGAMASDRQARMSQARQGAYGAAQLGDWVKNGISAWQNRTQTEQLPQSRPVTNNPGLLAPGKP